MISDSDISTFQSVCGTDNAELSNHFLEMAGGNLETAISLYFEHGGERQLKHDNSTNASNDSALAQDLQSESYQESDNYRPPDEARHETLVETNVFSSVYGGVGGAFSPLRNSRDMFDTSRPSGIFNQQLDVDQVMNDTSSSDDSEFSDDGRSSEDEQNYEYVEETIVEIDDNGAIKEYKKMVRRPKPMTKESKLALLFKPPFDMMAKLDLDGAKQRAREKKKWIMINIQSSDIFQCQMLNRDLWSDPNLKSFIKKNFVFLQYQYDSRSALPYIQRYGLRNKEQSPHIAILDPITGERLRQWNKEVIPVHAFREQLENFLAEFSLDPTSTNPTVKEPTPEIDPTTLSEEKQLELAIKESLGETSAKDETIQIDHQAGPDEPSYLDLLNDIKPILHEEPENKPGITTRIQIRTGDGKRLVKRFDSLNDNVRKIYGVIKETWPEYSQIPFVLTTHKKENLIEKLNESISDAGLKNSSLLLEVLQDDD